MEWINNIAENYDGYALREWLRAHDDVAIFLAGLYLAFVFKGPAIISRVLPPGPVDAKGVRQKPAWLRIPWVMWNLFLSVFSLYGTTTVTPYVLGSVKKSGLRNTLCTLDNKNYYEGPVGLALGLFVISKLPEFMDTVFLLLSGKKDLPFLQWFHHVTTFLFVWHEYAVGSSALYFSASLNYTVHTIMYFYFALAEAGLKRQVKPFAPVITLIQIAQMLSGLAFIITITHNKYLDIAAGRSDTAPGACSGTPWSSTRVNIFIAVVNFILFAQMFINSYAPWNKKKRQQKPAAAASVTVGAKQTKKQ